MSSLNSVTTTGFAPCRATTMSARLVVCLVLAAAAFVMLASRGFAQGKPTTFSPDDRTYLEKASLGEARAALFDHITGLSLESGLSVGAWAGRSVARDRELRMWVRTRPAAGPTRIYADGTAETDIRFDPAETAEFLRTVARKAETTADADIAAINTGSRAWQPLWITGEATLANRGGPDKPAGWEDISFEGIQIVRRAARADAIHELLDVIGKLKVTNARVLSEFLSSGDAVADAVASALEREASITIELAPDQVALATASISSTPLIRILGRVVAEQGASTGFAAEDFREMAVITKEVDLKATGIATVPPRYRLLATYKLIELDVPAWIDDTFRAEGAYVAEGETPPEERQRIAAARVNAIDALRRQVEALPVQGDTTVQMVLERHPELKDDVIMYLTGARVIGSPSKQGDADVTVRVELPARKLWHILRRGIRAVELDPAEAASQPTSRPALPPRGGERIVPQRSAPAQTGDH